MQFRNYGIEVVKEVAANRLKGTVEDWFVLYSFDIVGLVDGLLVLIGDARDYTVFFLDLKKLFELFLFW